MPNNLPLNWCECKLEAVCSLDNGQKQEGFELPLLDAKYLRGKKEPEYRSEGVILYPEDFVILVDGENSGEIFSIFQKGIMGSTFKKLNISSFCSVPYILYFIKSNQDLFRTNKKGAAIPHLDKALFKNLILSLPPLAEQERIVAKIEALFANIDSGVEKLKAAQAQIKQYRQSVLSAAFSGKLYKTTEWKDIKLSDITNALGGYAFKSKNFTSSGYQIVRMGNIKPLTLNLDERPVFIKDIDEKIIRRYSLQANDIVITLTGTRKKRDYGYVVLIKENNNLLLNQRLARLRPNKYVNAEYLAYVLQNEPYQSKFFSYETGNVGQGNVSMKALTDEFILLPSIQEQQRIVAEIENRFTVADELEKSITDALTKAEKLKQSILKQAFEGKLVPQDPNDEPASVLLERIKKEQKPTKGKKK